MSSSIRSTRAISRTITDRHNGVVRATSRLVLVWTSISLVAVAVGWAALDSAIGTGNPEPAEVAALDPSVLAPSPPAPSATTGKPLPDPKASPSKAARAVTSTGRRSRPRSTPDPTKSPVFPTMPPTPSASPSFEQDEPTSEPNNRAGPGEIVREVDTDGGSATIRFSEVSVHLLDYEVMPGYTVSGTREAEDYIIVRFLSSYRASTIHAYVDGDGTFRVKIIEERS